MSLTIIKEHLKYSWLLNILLFKAYIIFVGSQGSGSSGEATRPKRIKPIPPPLDLNARTLSPCDTLPQALPRSPGDFPRECLPIRKR